MSINRMYYKLGNNIKCLRESFDLSQEELAFEVGIGKSAVSQYETGASIPARDILLKIAKYFHVTETDLLQNDYTHLKKMTDAPVNKPEYGKSMFDKLFPFVYSISAMNNPSFKEAYELHNVIYDCLTSTINKAEFDEAQVEKCINLYEQARDEGIIEAYANHLWWICFLGFSTVFCHSRLIDAVERLNKGDITVKEFFKEGYLTALDDDTFKEENKIRTQSKNDFWKDCAVDFYVNVRKLKLNTDYSDLGDYYLSIAYIFDIVCNDMSSEQNSSVGYEMLSAFSMMGNPYAKSITSSNN